jgi:hypothetical protein
MGRKTLKEESLVDTKSASAIRVDVDFAMSKGNRGAWCIPFESPKTSAIFIFPRWILEPDRFRHHGPMIWMHWNLSRLEISPKKCGGFQITDCLANCVVPGLLSGFDY